MVKAIHDLEIQARVVPTHGRWPNIPTIHWGKLHAGVAALRALVAGVDASCLSVEADPDLSPEGLYRRRADIGRKGITELNALAAVAGAESAVAKAIATFESGMVADIPKPTSAADIAMGEEIRAFIRTTKSSPFDFAMRNINDPRVLAAVLHAPAFLTGLDDAMFEAIKAKAAIALNPEKLAQKKQAEGALEELRKGVDAAQRMIMSRTETVQDIKSGIVRGIRDPAPAPEAALPAAAQ